MTTRVKKDTRGLELILNPQPYKQNAGHKDRKVKCGTASRKLGLRAQIGESLGHEAKCEVAGMTLRKLRARRQRYRRQAPDDVTKIENQNELRSCPEHGEIVPCTAIQDRVACGSSTNTLGTLSNSLCLLHLALLNRVNQV